MVPGGGMDGRAAHLSKCDRMSSKRDPGAYAPASLFFLTFYIVLFCESAANVDHPRAPGRSRTCLEGGHLGPVPHGRCGRHTTQGGIRQMAFSGHYSKVEVSVRMRYGKIAPSWGHENSTIPVPPGLPFREGVYSPSGPRPFHCAC